MRTISLRERDEYTEVELSMKEYHFVVAQAKIDCNPIADRDGKYRLKSNRYVGVCSSGNIQLIINPKAGWVQPLLLLEYTKKYRSINIFERLARVSESEDLLKLIVRFFLDEVSSIVAKGLYREYHEQTKSLPYVQGKLSISQTVNRGSILCGKICCRPSRLTTDTIENQLLRKCLVSLKALNIIPEYSWRIDQLLESFRAVSSKEAISKFDFEKVSFNLLNRHYHAAIGFAKLQFLGLGLKLQKGENPCYSFWLNMERLFEEFLLTLVTNQLNEFNIQGQVSRKSREQSRYQTEIEMKPDIVVYRDDSPALVIDAKWKQEFTKADFYQIVSYAHRFSCPGVIILPSSKSPRLEQYRIGNHQIYRYYAPLEFTSIKELHKIEQNIGTCMRNLCKC